MQVRMDRLGEDTVKESGTGRGCHPARAQLVYTECMWGGLSGKMTCEKMPGGNEGKNQVIGWKKEGVPGSRQVSKCKGPEAGCAGSARRRAVHSSEPICHRSVSAHYPKI